MGTLNKVSSKCFRKSWSSIYSIEKFSKMVSGPMEMIMEDKGVGDFSNDIGDH
jgi:hypothetical protein